MGEGGGDIEKVTISKLGIEAGITFELNSKTGLESDEH
jgi:hypothetical protein